MVKKRQPEVVYTFENMMDDFRLAVSTFVDNRKGRNTRYEIMDAACGAFSVYFTQCPSFLSHQQLLEKRYGFSNTRTLFRMEDIPSDNQIRQLLDPTDPEALNIVFDKCFKVLDDSRNLNSFRVAFNPDNPDQKDLLAALDGTEYHSSEDIHCTDCSVRKKDGVIRYCHSMVTPTIVAPGNNKVISLAPSFVTPQDGEKKQDCELNAGKRWLKTYTLQNRLGGITILGDDLYAHEPFCRELLAKGYNFILVCKPDSHKTVYEWIKSITVEKVTNRFNGKKNQIYTYSYVEGIPLCDKKDALSVNFVEVTVKDRTSGEQVYHNAFITSHPLKGKTDQETIILLNTLIDAGRARWKIENENNNTLKTKGYHLEHNFGHGKEHLSALLATMNILAFLFHTMLELMNKKYQLLRKVIGARKQFFHHIKVLLIYIPFQSFDHLMTFMLEEPEEGFDLKDFKIPIRQ